LPKEATNKGGLVVVLTNWSQAYFPHLSKSERSGNEATTRWHDVPRGTMDEVGQLASHDRRLAMALQRGEVQGYNFNRMAVEFTMVNQGKVVPCSISTAAMDDLEGRRDVKSDQRIDQFMRLREIIEERASRKFFEEQAQADRPVVLRSNDFSS
jgi:hypothetical protein